MVCLTSESQSFCQQRQHQVLRFICIPLIYSRRIPRDDSPSSPSRPSLLIPGRTLQILVYHTATAASTEMEDSYKGKLSLLKKKRAEQRTFQKPAPADPGPEGCLLVGAPAASEMGTGALAVTAPEERVVVASEDRRRQMDDLKERCNSSNRMDSRTGPHKLLTGQSPEMGVAVMAARRPSQELKSRKNDSKEAAPPPLNVKLAIQWTCDECHHTCIPVRSESRCLW